MGSSVYATPVRTCVTFMAWPIPWYRLSYFLITAWYKAIQGEGMNQIEMELRFSKKQKDALVFDAFIDECDELISMLAVRLHAWKCDEFYPEKQELVDRLVSSKDIAVELVGIIIGSGAGSGSGDGSRIPIQGLAVELGKRLGYEDLIEAAKIGSSIISICHGDLYDIHLGKEGTYVVPKMSVDEEVKREIAALMFLPPNLRPMKWTSNHGGWQWAKRSVLLGSGNHHGGKQCLDVLNKLQEIPWEINLEVLSDLDISGASDGSDLPYGFMKAVGHYVGEKFYFNWQFDKRGRMYSSGYQLNVQGDEVGKALLDPVNGEVLSKEGVDALLKYRNTLKVGSPMFEKMNNKYNEFLEDPGKELACFVELDASASGYQMMSVLSGCVKTGKLCNLTSEQKQDMYLSVLEAIEEEIGDTGYTRKDVKKGIMTAAYNSKAKPKELFGEDVDVFWSVLGSMVPGAMDVMHVINMCWNEKALEHCWTMPDGHEVRVKVVEPCELRIGIEELDGRRFTMRYNRNQPSANGRSLVPNVVHSVDAYVCREVIRRCVFEVACIHDCWLMHPNNAAKVKQVYREILSEIASSSLLNDICSQITGRDTHLRIEDEGLADEILKSNYALS